MRKSWKPKWSATRAVIVSQWRRFNPGLGVRLGVAFAAAVVLALAANTIAERGADVVRHTLRVPPVPTVVPAPVVAVPIVPEPAEQPVQPPVVRAEPARIEADGALRALEDSHRFLQARLASADAGVEAQYQDSRGRLEAALARFEREAQRAGTRARRTLQSRREEYLATSADLAAAVHDRRTALAQYQVHAGALQALLRAKAEGGWRILGRLVSRQYLVDLRNDMEQLQLHVAQAMREVRPDPATLNALSASEDTLSVRFASVLPRLKGADAEWAARAEEQLAAMAPLRVRMMERSAAEPAALEQVEVHREALRAALGATAASANAVAARAANAGQGEAPASPASAPRRTEVHAPLQAPALAQVPVPVGEPLAGAPEAMPEAIPEKAQARQRDRLLPWISAAVVLLIFLICAATVRSIALQVRRLQQASARIASGEEVSVVPGGIRELDQLAESFNRMSADLQAARRSNEIYQRELESRVEQRTRALVHQATHDPLTDLPNRRQLHTLLEEASAAARESGALMGVFVLDLDNFKHVNDSVGHAFGDRVLVAVSERLRALVAPWGFAARLGGDEFTVVLTAAADVETVRRTGWELVRAFQQPLSVDGKELLLSTSVGASIYPDHESTPEELLRAADAALFRAKALGRSQLTVFTPELLAVAAERFSTEQGLRRAVERGEFELVFQPEVSLEDFQMRMVEALLRWRLPDGRHASPGEFLAVAEESGLITEISDWVLREAIRAAARWHHGEWPQVRVAINVSSRQMLSEGFVAQVAQLLQEHDLPARCIEIELTENVLQTGASTIRTLEGLRDLGVGVALDDFGTGYSSLTSIEKLPLSRIKLDRSLIEQLDSNPRSIAIAEAVITLCHGLGLEVTAEGIERFSQLERLMPHPSLLVQGYLLSRPVAAADLAAARDGIAARLDELLLCQGASARAPVAPPAAPAAASA